MNSLPEHTPNDELVERVTSQRDRFLRFLVSRVEDKATAEDILQTAYLKAIKRGSEIRKHESTVAWFYCILRNAMTDHYRRRASKARAHEALANEMPGTYELEIKATVCDCIGDVIDNLKPEYRSVIELAGEKQGRKPFRWQGRRLGLGRSSPSRLKNGWIVSSGRMEQEQRSETS